MIDSYLTEKIQLIKDNGSDQWETPNAPTVPDVWARVLRRSELIRNAKGEEVNSNASAKILDTTVTLKDKLRIDNKDYPIIKIDPAVNGDNQTEYLKLFV